jgi:hypothetical protein
MTAIRRVSLTSRQVPVERTDRQIYPAPHQRSTTSLPCETATPTPQAAHTTPRDEVVLFVTQVGRARMRGLESA